MVGHLIQHVKQRLADCARVLPELAYGPAAKQHDQYGSMPFPRSQAG
jgi:hypothetical protein